MKVYLSGPMSGIPAFNFPAFEHAASVLRAAGHEVISPVELDDPEQRAVSSTSPDGNPDTYASHGMSRDDFLARDAAVIVANSATLDGIVCLPGWQASDGARFEIGVAALRGIPRYDYDEDEPTAILIEGADEMAQAALYDAAGNWIKDADNPLRQRAITGGVKDNRGKSRVDLIPFNVLLRVGHVLGFGASKYKPHNWRLGLGWSDTIGSALRHIFAFAEGENIDAESGQCHIDNAITQLIFLSEYYHTGTGIDDRWSSVSAADREAAKA